MSINPPGKLQSTLKGIKVHYLAHPRGLDGSDAMRLGGAYSLHLRGPTPVSEVSNNLVSSRERVVKLGSAPSHIPLCRAFTYLIDG